MRRAKTARRDNLVNCGGCKVATRYYGWRVLFALCFVICVNMAFPIYGASVMNTAMAVDMHWDRQSLGLLVAANMLTNGLAAPVAAVVVNRYGARLSLTVGSLLMLVATTAMATLVTNSWQGVIAFGLIGGLGTSFGAIVACQTAVAAWFGRRRARALSILYSATGIGGFIAPTLFSAVISGSGGKWQLAWWTFALFAAAALVTTLLFVRNTPAEANLGASEEVLAELSPESAQAGATEAPPAAEWTTKAALRSPMCWLVLLCMASLMSGASFYIAHGQALLHDLGYSVSAASMSVAIMAGASLLGNAVIGAFGDKVGPRPLLAGAMIVYALGLLLLPYASGAFGLYLYAPVMGIGFGAAQVGSMALLSQYFGTRPFASLSGVGVLVQTASASVIPIIAGAYFDAHHSYMVPIFALIALNVAVGAVLFAARRPPQQPVVAGG
jgi:MFS family permease